MGFVQPVGGLHQVAVLAMFCAAYGNPAPTGNLKLKQLSDALHFFPACCKDVWTTWNLWVTFPNSVTKS